MINGLKYIIFGFSILQHLIISQISKSDSNQMSSIIKSTKDEKTGLYGVDFEATYKSVFSLQVLGEEIRDIPKICKELGYESQRSTSRYIVLLDEILKCKNEITKTSEKISNITSLSVFYESLFLGLRNDASINFELVLLQLQSYQNKDKLFNPDNIDNPLSNQISLLYTAYGLKSIALIIDKVPKKSRDYLVEDVKEIVAFIFKNYFQHLNSVIILNRNNLVIIN